MSEVQLLTVEILGAATPSVLCSSLHFLWLGAVAVPFSVPQERAGCKGSLFGWLAGEQHRQSHGAACCPLAPGWPLLEAASQPAQREEVPPLPHLAHSREARPRGKWGRALSLSRTCTLPAPSLASCSPAC